MARNQKLRKMRRQAARAGRLAGMKSATAEASSEQAAFTVLSTFPPGTSPDPADHPGCPICAITAGQKEIAVGSADGWEIRTHGVVVDLLPLLLAGTIETHD